MKQNQQQEDKQQDWSVGTAAQFPGKQATV